MTQSTQARTPVCTLAPDDLTERITAWHSLTARALHRTASPGRVVATYANDADTAALLDRLVAAESECCPFLTFDVRAHGDTITVELRHPPEFAAMLGAMFSIESPSG